MKNFLSSPTNGQIFKRYAPLLQGGLMKVSMLAGIIILCSFTMFRFLHTQMSGMSDILTSEQIEDISMAIGGVIGSLSIVHFASLLPLVVRDLIQLKKDGKEVHKGVLAINLLLVIAILGFDGYVSTTGIKNAVKDMGEDFASDKYTNESLQINTSYSQDESKIMSLWRVDSANIVSFYNGKISAEKAKANGEIGDLNGKANRGAAAGSTSWASSLRSIASSKSANLENKVGKLESEKAESLLKRAEKRDNQLSEKQGERKAGLTVSDEKGKKIENRFARYGGMTWILSLGLYLIYIGTVIKHELIHFGAGIQNDVEISDHYFKSGFVQTFLHEVGNLLRDLGMIFNGWIASLRQKIVGNNKYILNAESALLPQNQKISFSASAQKTEISNNGTEISKPKSKMQKDMEFASMYQDNAGRKVTIYPEGRKPFVKEFNTEKEANEYKEHFAMPIQVDRVEPIAPPLPVDEPPLNYFTWKGLQDKKAMMKHRSKEKTVTQGTLSKNNAMIQEAEKEIQKYKKQYEMEF